jgi:glutamine---fructose-6-phosphate transaminase (isomerizing)
MTARYVRHLLPILTARACAVRVRSWRCLICNVATSAMVRECELAYITRAGVEIGVASTKAFTTQLAGLYLLTLALAQVRGRLSDGQEAAHLKALRHLPVALQSVLALEPQIIAWSADFARKENALFLGRGLHHPVALEGALKLKEISCIHAQTYPAGELIHRPLALVTAHMPVVTVAPNDALSPILHVVPLQRLAHHTACVRRTDVDKPRNLAKSVTVE